MPTIQLLRIMEARFKFWMNYLKLVSLFFAFLGILWAVIGSFDPLGIYDQWMAQSFYGADELPSEVSKAMKFILAPFGMTSAGYFVLQYFITTHAFAKKEKWAYNAIVFAFLFWFVGDTVLCFYHAAYFNIILANLPALMLMLPVIVFTKKYF